MGLNVGFVSTGEPVNWARESVFGVQDSQIHSTRSVGSRRATILDQLHDKHHDLHGRQRVRHPRQLLLKKTLLLPRPSIRLYDFGRWRIMCRLVHPVGGGCIGVRGIGVGSMRLQRDVVGIRIAFVRSSERTGIGG